MLAFDVGGTDIKVGLVVPPCRLLGLQRLSTPRDSMNPGEAVLEKIVSLTRSYRERYPEHPFEAVGIVVPGLVEEAAGVGIYSANLGWKNYPFRSLAEQRLNVPVAFGHDVGAAGEVELRIGTCKNASNVVVLVIGTGIAGAIFCDGRRITGDGYAGEFGCSRVPDPDHPGATTFLEAVGSAGAVASRYSKATGNSVEGAREVLRRSEYGDVEAGRIWAEAVDALAFSIAQCVSILGSEMFVIGGGLSSAGKALLTPLRLRVDALLTFHRRPELVLASLGENAGLVGAAVMARDLIVNPGGEQ